MKKNLLMLAFLGILFTSCKNSVLDELQPQKENSEKQSIYSSIALNQIIKTDRVFQDDWNGLDDVPFRSRHYYPSNGLNLPVVVIAHADGASQDYTDYDNIGFALAAQNMYVISINRKSYDMGAYHTFDALLTAHLKRLYLDKNGQTLPLSTTSSDNGFQILRPLSKNVMLIGHSAGGRAMLYKGPSIIQNLHLDLKAVVGLAPTMNPEAPVFSNVPFFMIQGTADTDGGICNHYQKASNVFDARAKVPVFEGYAGNQAERAYIMLHAAHYMEGNSKVVALTKAIALAYLKTNRTLLNQYIRNQTNKLEGTWVQYWDNENQEVVYNALPVFGQASPPTLTANGVYLSQNAAYRHLGNDPERTSTLHRSYALKITKNIFQLGKHQASFKIVFPQTIQNRQYLRFRAGELFDFTQREDYSAEGLDIRIRLIYKGIYRNSVSKWASMSNVCGKVINPHTLLCPRNIMSSYVMPLTAFGYNGQQISGVEFDLGGDFNQTLMMDDIAFTYPLLSVVNPS